MVSICGPFWTLWRDGKWAGVQVRFFGYYLTLDRRSLHWPLFSERYGRERWYYLGPLCMKAGWLG